MAVNYEKSCAQKVRFQTRGEAKKARSHTRGSGPLSVYPCLFCGFFHLGHLPKEIRRGEVDKREWRAR